MAVSGNKDMDRFRFDLDDSAPAAPRKKSNRRSKTAAAPGMKTAKTTSRQVSNPFAEGGTRCGKEFDNVCPDSQCCSQWGWCDVGPQYCGAGCQAGYGKCDGDNNGGGDNGGGGTGTKATVHTQCKEPGTVAITFDDGPAETTAGLLRLLDRYQLKVTFFVNGKNYLDPSSSVWKSSLRQAFDAGHLIASHTYEHVNLAEASDEEVRSQMTQNEDAVEKVIGKRMAIMRPPYGAVSDSSLRILHDMGYEVVNWDIETLDTEHHNAQKSAAAYEKVLKASDPSKEGHIALEHDPEKSSASQLIPLVMPLLKKYGFRAVLIDECLGLVGKAYRD